MPDINKPSIQLLILWKLRLTLPQYNLNLTIIFTLLVSALLSAPPIALVKLSENFIEDTKVLLKIDYSNWFNISLNFFLTLDLEINRLSIY